MASKTSDTDRFPEFDPESESDAVAVPDSVTPRTNLTIEVTLPEEVHSTPDDELAVALGDATLNAGQVLDEDGARTSINLVPVIPELPKRAEPAGAHSSRARLRGRSAVAPETAAMLTSERLIEQRRRGRARPEGFWQELVYSSTLHLVNLGDSARVRARKELDARIGKRLDGGTRFVPVLTRKGGVGKTTITALLGMALANVREDRVIAIDANPDRGTLAERVARHTSATVRDVILNARSISSFSDFTKLVSRDETRLDILASDSDPLLSEAFDADDYNVVAELAARFYSIVLTDCGTGIVHSAMRATLQHADSVVIVSGGSVDEARLASETLTWLEANDYEELARNAVVALNTGTQGTNMVNIDEVEAHFSSRVREVVRIPYDPMLASGAVIDFDRLEPLTRATARDLAASVVDGLPSTKDD
ncbi:MAG TPA: MinD/ParA family protein [Terrimesophilobacter sp.]|nr:MinD/ParA family protein [Terrimesophilobacter sp.]